MSHYLVLTCMQEKSLEFMLDTLKHGFYNDPEYCRRFDLCTCQEKSYPCIRELRLFEIDVPTPACEHFEAWLEEWGFADLMERNLRRARQNKLWLFPLKLFWKLFYKILNFIVTVGDPQLRKHQFLGNPKGQWLALYRPFSSMLTKYALEHERKYEGQLKLNQRNFIIGKLIETPVGSYDRVRCDKCGAKHTSRH